MRLGLSLLAALLALGGFLFFRGQAPSQAEHRHPNQSAVMEPPPLCPWREPRRDLPALFPGATNWLLETRIVTALLGPMQQRLGRPLNPDENPLRIHRVLREGQPVGSVLVTRVRGEHGGIELLTAIDSKWAVRAVLIQSQREPEPIAQTITDSNFLARFAGKDASSPMRVGVDLPEVPPAARETAQTVADGVRHQLIVFSFAQLPQEARELGISTNR